MSWFLSRRKPKGEYPAEVGVTKGPHRSPGLAALTDELERRRIEAILDLGASSGENLTFFGRFCDNIVIRDLVSSRGEELAAPRASLFQLDVGSLDPNDELRYDVILLWDLLHYVERSRVETLIRRLGKLARPGALLLLLASSSTPIPLTPVKFKIQDRGNLVYDVRSERRGAAPHFTPRGVEKLMVGFQPVRFFQLRNGLQEFLFRYEGVAVERNEGLPDEPQEVGSLAPKAAMADHPGDWY